MHWMAKMLTTDAAAIFAVHMDENKHKSGRPGAFGVLAGTSRSIANFKMIG